MHAQSTEEWTEGLLSIPSVSAVTGSSRVAFPHRRVVLKE